MFEDFHSTLTHTTKILKRPSVKRFFLFSFISIIVFAVAWHAYAAWQERIESRAHGALAELLERYEAAASIGSEVNIRELSGDIKTAYDQNKNSLLAPYFLICKAHCLYLLNEDDEALISIDEACILLRKQKNNQLGIFYAISLAHLLLNSDKEEMINRGLDLLRICSVDRTNPYHEMALYSHGLYLLKNKSLAEADAIWLPLLSDPAYRSSPWRDKVMSIRS